MTRVHIVGAAGYAAGDLIRILEAHPHVELATLESESAAGQPVCDVFRGLPAISQRFDPPGSALDACESDDVVFLAGESEKSRLLAPKFLGAGARVIDLSDAFRVAHPEAVYGFPERYRDQIASARLVANPGCYPIASLLAILPLAYLRDRILQIVIDAKSGITGAGRSPKGGSMYAEVDGDVRVYGLPAHRHAKEIGHELRAMGIAAPFAFTPHVVPISRGLLADVYLFGDDLPGEAEIRAAFTRAYDGDPFVRVLDGMRVPYLPALAHTNDAQLAISVRDGIVHIMSGDDNLGKGAAGNAVQNLNIMCGFPEESGLGHRTPVH
ncbi:MAG: N-acetyl-gamma-glutamyl-phosphate reductase [Candidatus Eremiobacteraeota bacterium]|nr:N-acetyl-gamma-glutamyl-phosphate reductase [Candidatus Eremiobacteraeota bacterium]MBV8353882.1 N-acetyl-gamma-glutamyl-phosphate reductase [Candidatus Eremiobacteraeota bacterium]